MAARTPRRTFAAPLVAITLAAAPACRHETPIGPVPNPPPPEHPVSADAAAAVTPDAAVAEAPIHRPIMNPPRPTPPPATTEGHWTASKHNGTCVTMNDDACGHPAAGQPIPPCNPPPPSPYACPAFLAEGEFVKIVRFPGADRCEVMPEPVHCPPQVMCNPGPPREVPCPSR